MTVGPRARILYGVGYQGRDVADLIGALRAVGVSTVVDVRLNPISRRPGFSKGALAHSLGAAGIAYVHERTLGNPRENRAGFARHKPASARQVLLERLCTDGADAMHRLVGLTASQVVAVLCVERSPEHCHRAVVLERARVLDPGLDTADIG